VKPLDPRLLRYSAAARGYLAVTVALGLAATGLILIQASLLARLLAGAATGTGLTVLGAALAALVGVLVARAAASYGGEVTALRAAAAVKSQLRRRLVDHALRLGPSWLARHQPQKAQMSGEVTTLATRGLDGLDAYFARYLPQLVLACLVPVAVLIRVGFADWISAVVIGVTLPLIPVFAILVGLHTKTVTRRQWRLLARLGGHFLDVVEGLPTLKLFGRGKPQAEVIGTVTEEYRAVTMSTLRVAFLSAFVLELAAALATALVAVEVGLRLLAGHMSYQTALLVLLLTPEAYLPLRAVGAQFHASTEGAAAARDVFEILDTPAPATADPKNGKTQAPVRRLPLRDGIITLRGVSLAYPGRDHQALSGVHLTIRPGDRITLAGPSGAGKSSLLALLLRFAEPTGGRIEVGGVDLRSIPVGEWRRQISWVPQQPYLFTTSVAANIALGQPAASPAAIARAAQAAGAAEFIEGLPRGYATEVGERGLRLSSGQRQQIALARAFLRDAPLLLLDEPTAHLDAVSGRRLEHAIAALTADRTVIQVTHSQTRTRDIGRTFTLEDGILRQASSPCPAPASPAQSLPAPTSSPPGPVPSPPPVLLAATP
jgi:ATP-binding cassette subfamily C protein CydD